MMKFLPLDFFLDVDFHERIKTPFYRLQISALVPEIFKFEKMSKISKQCTTYKSLTGQRHDRVQTESQIATVDSCFDLVGSRQHGVASYEVISWLTDIHILTECRW